MLTPAGQFSTVRIIPVIDLLQGQVVRGVAGRRESYQPIQSQIAANAQPATVAASLVKHFQAKEIYVADLDAIQGADVDLDSLHSISQSGARLWIDAGSGDAGSCQQLLEGIQQIQPAPRVIVGLESIAAPGLLMECLQLIGPERAIFSLDLQQGRPIDPQLAWPQDPAEIAALAVDVGFKTLVVLDLAGVGIGQGLSTQPLCRQLSDSLPQIEWISGGGVRDQRDLESMAEHGIAGALVASALHDGRISAATS